LDNNVYDLYGKILINYEIRKILSNNDILHLSVHNSIYLKLNSKKNKLKVDFTSDLITEFNSIIRMINNDKNNINNDNRYDIIYLNEINRKINDMVKLYKILSNKDKTVDFFYSDIDNIIHQEQKIVSKLIIDIKSLVLNEKIELKIHDEVIPLLRNREEKLLKLSFNNKKQLKKFIRTNEDIEIFRLKMERIIKSAIILSLTLKILIINIGILRNSNNNELKNLIIDDMIYAINYLHL